jgi:hypothetical protein
MTVMKMNTFGLFFTHFPSNEGSSGYLEVSLTPADYMCGLTTLDTHSEIDF